MTRARSRHRLHPGLCGLLLILVAGLHAYAEETNYAAAMRSGKAHTAEHEYAEAAAAFATAAEAARRRTTPGASGLELQALRHRTGCLHRLGRFVDLRSVLQRILVLQKTSKDQGSALLTLVDLSLIELELGNPRGSLEQLATLRSALGTDTALGSRAKTRVARIDAEIRTAEALRRLRQYGAAFRHVEQALELLGTPTTTSAHLGEALCVKATIHLELGDLEQARRIYGLAERHLVGRPDQLGALKAHLGIASYEDGDHAGAQRLLKEAGTLFRGIGWTERAERVRIQRAVAYLHAKEYDLALDQVGQASENDPLKGYAAAYRHLYRARAQLGLGRTTPASRELASAVAAAKALGDQHLLAEATAELAGLALARGALADAEKLAIQALDHLDGIVAQLSPASGAEARHARGLIYEIAARVGCATGDPARAFRLLERGRAAALVEMLEGSEALSTLKLPASLLAEAQRLREDLRQARIGESIAAQSGSLKLSRAARDRRKVAVLAYDGIRRRLQREARGLNPFLRTQPVPLAEVTAGLASDERMVLYSVTDDAAHALVIGGKRNRIVDLGNAAALRKAVETLDVLEQEGAELQSARDVLHKALLGRLKLTPSVRRLLISPDDTIGGVPFPFLDPTLTFAFVPSGSVYHLLAPRRARSGGAMLAVGDPRYEQTSEGRALAVYFGGQRLQPLPGTREEIDAIRRPGDLILLGAKASEGGFLTAATGGKHWDTLVLACHGMANAHRPSQSGLALTPDAGHDGYLSALEIFGVRIPADLVVLSACNSGRSTGMRGDGMIGLAGAFLHAGAARVIGSLWKVDDAATTALMTRFHELWRPKGKARPLPAGEALHQAQAHVRNDSDHPAWKHPEYWAGWVLWGRPD